MIVETANFLFYKKFYCFVFKLTVFVDIVFSFSTIVRVSMRTDSADVIDKALKINRTFAQQLRSP